MASLYTRIPVAETPDLRGFPFHYTWPSGAVVDAMLFYCERPTIIDAAYFRYGLQIAGGTVTLERCPSGTALGSGTALTSALAVSDAGLINTNLSFSLLEAQTIIPAGNWITLDSSATLAMSNATLFMRLRTVR